MSDAEYIAQLIHGQEALRAELAAERKRREAAELVARDNLDWFDALKADYDTARAQVAKLREALEPFAAHADLLTDDDPEDTIICGFDGQYLRAGDVRHARAVLKETGDTNEG